MNAVAAASPRTTAALPHMAKRAISRVPIAVIVIIPAEAPGASSSAPAAGVCYRDTGACRRGEDVTATAATTTATTAVRIDKGRADYHGVEPRSKPSAQRNVY